MKREEMNNLLFRLTSWGLLALAWAWLTLKLLPDHVKQAKYSAIIAGILGDDPVEVVTIHPIVEFAGRNPGYFFVAGILGAVWCRSLVRRTEKIQETLDSSKETTV